MAGNIRILTDCEIIELYFIRSENAIRETERKYGSYLNTIAYNILRSKEDSEECVSDTYMKVWNSIPPERPKSFRGFIAKITRNLAINICTMRKREKRIPEDAKVPLSELERVIGNFPDIYTIIDAKRTGQIISEYIDRLSDRSAYIFLSRYFFAMTVDEIAAKLLCSRSTVNKELAKMRNELKEKLDKEGVL